VVDLNRAYGGQGSSLEYTAGDLKFQIGYDWASQNDHRQRYENLKGTIGEQTLNQNEIFNALGGYLITQWQKNNWTLSGGLRYDQNILSIKDRFLSNGDASDEINLNALSPQIGFSYQLSNLSFFGGYSSAYETPTLSELSATADGRGGFNNDLNIQQARQIELGMRYKGSKLKGSMAWYTINTLNDILPYESASFPSQTLYQNIGETLRTGVEWEASYQPFSSLKIQANYNRAANTFKNGEFKNNELPGIAKDFGLLSISKRVSENLSISYKKVYRGVILANNDNSVSIPKMSVDHLDLVWSAQKVTFTSGIQNLFDKTYSDNIRINAFGGRYYETALPRQVFLGLNATF
jgi:iron complex outermembrane receptor protein